MSIIPYFLFLSGLTSNTYTRYVHSISKRNLHVPRSKKPLIWVYDLRDLSLIAGAPFSFFFFFFFSFFCFAKKQRSRNKIYIKIEKILIKKKEKQRRIIQMSYSN
jgi:hypothetical protein